MRPRLILYLFCLLSIPGLAQEQVSVETVIGLALEHNYDVRIQKNVVESAETDVRYQIGAFVPTFNASGSVVRTFNDATLRFNDEAKNVKGPIESANTSALVQMSWTLFDGTRMFAMRSIVKETEAQSQLQLKDQMVNTIANIIQIYYDIVRQKQQLKAIQEQMAVGEERVKLAERKFQVGTGAKPELLQAKVDYNAFRTAEVRQDILIAQLKEQLDAMVDRKLPHPYEVTDSILIDLDIDETVMVANVESRNYSLQAARSGMEVAKDAIWDQRAQGLPSLNFNAAYTYTQTDNFKQISPFGFTYNLSQGTNLGFTLNIPLLNNFNNRRLLQQARIFSRRQELFFDQQVVNINAALRIAFTNYDNAKKVLVVEEENIILAKENVTIALEVFRKGASTFVELRTAQQSLADAYTRLINARYLAKIAETELLRLNGSLLQ